jgi:hypothetical protein
MFGLFVMTACIHYSTEHTGWSSEDQQAAEVDYDMDAAAHDERP